MQNLTFITGNQHKADYLAKYLGYPVEHVKVDLDEIQSLDLRKIVEHKVLQAYAQVQGPVLVEDVSLEFEAFGRLPGPFIKFYVETVPFDRICAMLTGLSRRAVARCVFGYYDGVEIRYFESSLGGTIPEMPAGDKGFGWDALFVPDGYTVTRASLAEADNIKTYLQIKPFAQFKAFLETRSGGR